MRSAWEVFTFLGFSMYQIKVMIVHFLQHLLSRIHTSGESLGVHVPVSRPDSWFQAGAALD